MNHNQNRQRQFQNINQGFGGFNMMSEFERMIGMDNFDDAFDDMFMMRNPFHHFHGLLNEAHGMGNQAMFDMDHQGQRFGPDNCTMITKSYVTKMDYSDGTPHQETYKSQSIKHMGQDGKKIHEKQEAYKNSKTGVERAGFQRMLNDRGQKCIKERNTKTGKQDAHVLYKGMQENDLDNFNQEYGQYRQQVNFQKNYDMLASMHNNQRRIADGRGGNAERRGRGQQQVPLGLPSGYEEDNGQGREYQDARQKQHKVKKNRSGKNMSNPKKFYGGAKNHKYE